MFMGILMEWLMEIIDDFIDGDANEATEEYDCPDTMRVVFKAYAVSLDSNTLRDSRLQVVVRLMFFFP